MGRSCEIAVQSFRGVKTSEGVVVHPQHSQILRDAIQVANAPIKFFQGLSGRPIDHASSHCLLQVEGKGFVVDSDTFGFVLTEIRNMLEAAQIAAEAIDSILKDTYHGIKEMLASRNPESRIFQSHETTPDLAAAE